MSPSARLEGCAYAIILLNLISHIHLRGATYNTGLGLFALLAQSTRRGRHVLGFLAAMLLAFVIDLLWFIDILGEPPTAEIIISAIVEACTICFKILSFASAYQLFIELGGTWSLSSNTVPLEGDDKSSSYGGGRYSDVSGLDHITPLQGSQLPRT